MCYISIPYCIYLYIYKKETIKKTDIRIAVEGKTYIYKISIMIFPLFFLSFYNAFGKFPRCTLKIQFYIFGFHSRSSIHVCNVYFSYLHAWYKKPGSCDGCSFSCLNLIWKIVLLRCAH